MSGSTSPVIRTVRIAARSKPVRIKGHSGCYMAQLPGRNGRRRQLSLAESEFQALAGQGDMVVLAPQHWEFRLKGLAENAEDEDNDASLDVRPLRRVDVLGWLQQRTDRLGQPLLESRAFLAGRKLQMYLVRAGGAERLTPDIARPAVDGHGASGLWPVERALLARQSIRVALDSIREPARRLVEMVCLEDCPLQVAETILGLKARTGRRRLQEGLADLADHYRL